MKMRRLLYTVLLIGLGLGHVHQSTAATPSKDNPSSILRVAISEAPPFAHKTPQGDWEGVAVDLWKEIAAGLNWKFRWHECSKEELLHKVAAGEADLAISDMAMTSEREAVMDFSIPFLTSELAMIVIPEPEPTWRMVWAHVFQPQILWTFGGLFILLAGVGFLIWWMERKQNPAEFNNRTWKGIGSGMWFAAVTMTTVGYGDKVPISAAGRILAMVWMLMSLLLVSTFTAKITTSLTIKHFNNKIQNPSDLSNVVSTAVQGSPGETYLRMRNLRMLPAKSPVDALKKLKQRKASALIHDRIMFRTILREGDESVQILPHHLSAEDFYAFALPTRSNLMEPLNRQLLAFLNTPRWYRIKKSYLTD